MTSEASLPAYEARDLARQVEALSEADINRLPFGAIRLNEEGVVAFYSEAERYLSGSGMRERLGRRFFGEIAPCMDTASYRGRIEAAMKAGTLDLEFTHIGDFSDRNRELTVRVQSATGGGYWIFMRRDS